MNILYVEDNVFGQGSFAKIFLTLKINMQYYCSVFTLNSKYTFS
ncbi:hypothetical protein BHO_0900040 (plasmid) [Borrelia hermsii YBT]|uniref:Uncharacterized protein n=1 Tax=Borrelia hermsii YBT TaxID=1313295 RepID=W5T0T5_BORHE|nr:hypothetical protein BHO_0900040 [Borrelia hermsii YBT]